MATQAQKTQEAISQATVEFKTDLVIANPRNGIYAVNVGSGFLRITLPKEKNDELLALRRANASSAQAWMDSTSETIRRQYEKTNSASFTFTLTPVGEVKAAKAEEAPSRVPIKITAPPRDTTKSERRGETVKSTEEPAAKPEMKAAAPQISVPKAEMAVDTAATRKAAEQNAREAEIRETQKSIPEFRGGTGTSADPYLLDFTAKGEKKGLGAISIVIPFTLADTYVVHAEVALSQLGFGGAIKDTYLGILATSRTLIKRLNGEMVSTQANVDDFKSSVERNLRKMNPKALEYLQNH